MDVISDVSPYLVPIVGIDIWEHAYYLDYRNSREDYLKNIWKIVNWNMAEERLMAAKLTASNVPVNEFEFRREESLMRQKAPIGSIRL